MVEVVVSLAHSHDGSEKVVAGRVFIIEGGLTQPVSKRVYAEDGL